MDMALVNHVVCLFTPQLYFCCACTPRNDRADL